MQNDSNHSSDLPAVLRALRVPVAAVAIVAIVALALMLSACAVDQESVTRKRADLLHLCEGALSLPLKAACARAGIPTGPAPVQLQP